MVLERNECSLLGQFSKAKNPELNYTHVVIAFRVNDIKLYGKNVFTLCGVGPHKTSYTGG